MPKSSKKPDDGTLQLSNESETRRDGVRKAIDCGGNVSNCQAKSSGHPFRSRVDRLRYDAWLVDLTGMRGAIRFVDGIGNSQLTVPTKSAGC